MDQHRLGLLEERPLVKQRAGQRVAQRPGGPVLAIGEARSEQAARAIRAQRAHQVVEPDIDETGPDDQADDGFHRLADHVVGGEERVMDALFGDHEFAHAVVIEGDEGVGKHGQFVERGFGLIAAAFALEGKWHGREHHHKRPFLTRDARHNGCRARSRATTQADA